MTASNRLSRTYRGLSAAERRAERRLRLLEAGLNVFATDGYTRASVEGVCQRASVSTRDFYGEFGGREQLLRAVYDAIIEDVGARIGAGLAAADGTLEGEARAALGGFTACFAEDERKARVNFVEVIGVSEEFEARRREVLHGFRDLIASRAAPLVGVTEEQLRLTAMALVGATQESMIDWVLDARRGRASLERVVADLTGVYIASLERWRRQN